MNFASTFSAQCGGNFADGKCHSLFHKKGRPRGYPVALMIPLLRLF
ncbi:MAG: hypothetical protein ACI8YI_001550 [Paracoccaceae bacterium]